MNGRSADVIDLIYRLRNMAGAQADSLRAAISEAQELLAKLESFADDAEEAAEWSVAGPRARAAGWHGGAQGQPNPGPNADVGVDSTSPS